MSARAIRSICVAGGGIVGLSAALAFSRALPGVAVTILETPDDPNALLERQPASLPTIHRFHRAIGLDELDLVRAGTATHLLGTRFEHWSSGGAPWIHAFGEHGLPAGEVPFHAIWQRASCPVAFHRFAAAAMLGEVGKFVHPSGDPRSPLGTFLYGLRLDPVRYRERLIVASQHLPRVGGAVAGAERRPDGGIAALLVAGGTRIEADLFVDCTGPSAAVMSLAGGAWEDWSRWFPFTRFRMRGEERHSPTSCDVVTASDSGWRWRSPLADRTMVIEAAAEEGEIILSPGRRTTPWVRNVLAVGESAVGLDPLYGAGLHLAHGAILRALDLLPGRDCHPLELREYGRRTEQEVARVRDLLALHYLRSGRTSGSWTAAAAQEPPPYLARTLTQFARRGRLPFFEEESFEKDSWLAVLLGLGIVPRHVDPAAFGVDLEQAVPAIERYAGTVRSAAAAAPPYERYLERLKAARP